MKDYVNPPKSILHRFAFLAAFLLPIAGDVSAAINHDSATHPEFKERIQNLENTVSTQPDLELFLLGASGARELHPEWTETAKANTIKLLSGDELEHSPLAVDFLEAEADDTPELREVFALNERIVANTLRHIKGEKSLRFHKKAKAFEYSVGNLDALIPEGADSLLVIQGYGEFSSAGRQGLMLLGVVAGAATGVAIIPLAGSDFLSCSLYDAEGDLLWLGYRSKAFRDEEDLRELLDSVFEKWPKTDPS
jgi:hypothetical protein